MRLHIRNHWLVVIGTSFAAGCGASGEDAAASDALTREQKDSIVADLPVPGASGVSGAMGARDRANARAAELDSIRE